MATMEVASGSMILHPDLAGELRVLHESSSFESAGTFLKHLFALEEQHRSQQCLSTLFTNVEQPWLGNYSAVQTASVDTAPTTASVGTQVKLCLCSDNILESSPQQQGVSSDVSLLQQGDLQDKLSDSDSDYNDTEEVFEEVDEPNSRQHKQGKEGDEKVQKPAGQPTSNRKKPNPGATHRFSCEECGAKFARECYLSHHMKKHRGEETTVRCQFCELIYPSPWTLTLHISRMHPEHAPPPRDKPPKNPFICATCGMALKTLWTYRQHQRTHTDERPYECSLCSKTFRASSSLAMHKLGMHTQERPYPCHVCGKNFKHSSAVKRHQVVHTGEKRYKCMKCSKAYTSINALQFHRLRYHEDPGAKPCKCPHCNKCFAKKFSMNCHIRRKHLFPEQYQRKPYQLRNPPLECSFHCEICSKSFRYAGSLKRHYIVHTGEQRFKCTQCDKAYRDNHSLKSHILRYHENPGVKPYQCSHCDKSFAKRSSLLSHFKKTHENPRPAKLSFQCDVCGKVCISASKLRRHIVTHTRERAKRSSLPSHAQNAHENPEQSSPPKLSFQCDVCNKVCVSASKLRRHIVTHTRERPFQCTLCDKAYRANETLRNHILTQHDKPHTEPCECPQCGKRFARQSSRTNHIKKQHGEPGQSTKKEVEHWSSDCALTLPAHIGMTRVVSKGFKTTATIRSAPLVLPAIP